MKTAKHLTVNEVAERWGVERETVIAYLKAGHLPGAFDARRPGARRATYRIPISAISAFEASREVLPRPSAPARRSRRRVAAVREYV